MTAIRNLGALIVDELRVDFLRRAFQSIGPQKFLLDLGCGKKPFQNLYGAFAQRAVGIDVPHTLHGLQQIDVQAAGTALPFQAESFDVVLCTEVMEHIAEPKLLVQEIHRVLKQGGHLILTTPFLVPEHEAPYDFFRYTRYGLRHLLQQASFQVTSIEPFAEMFGVLLSFLVQMQLKFWTFAATATRIAALARLTNPFVFLLVFIPQKLYLVFVRHATRVKSVERAMQRLTYTCKGFGTIACKS